MYSDVVFWLIWDALKKNLPVIHAMHPLIISLCLFQILFLIPVTLKDFLLHLLITLALEPSLLFLSVSCLC